MPNRDGTGPQGRGPMTGAKMGSCSDPVHGAGKNISFGRGQGRRCGKGLKKGLGNRWTSIAESEEKITIEGE